MVVSGFGGLIFVAVWHIKYGNVNDLILIRLIQLIVLSYQVVGVAPPPNNTLSKICLVSIFFITCANIHQARSIVCESVCGWGGGAQSKNLDKQKKRQLPQMKILIRDGGHFHFFTYSQKSWGGGGNSMITW